MQRERSRELWNAKPSTCKLNLIDLSTPIQRRYRRRIKYAKLGIIAQVFTGTIRSAERKSEINVQPHTHTVPFRIILTRTHLAWSWIHSGDRTFINESTTSRTKLCSSSSRILPACTYLLFTLGSMWVSKVLSLFPYTFVPYMLNNAIPLQTKGDLTMHADGWILCRVHGWWLMKTQPEAAAWHGGKCSCNTQQTHVYIICIYISLYI